MFVWCCAGAPACSNQYAMWLWAPAFAGATTTYFGPEIVFDDPSGAACMPGGVWPCGLSAGAPPWPVVIGPVGPCGCIWPLSFNSVLPVECCECRLSAGSLLAGVSADATENGVTRQSRMNRRRMISLRNELYFKSLGRRLVPRRKTTARLPRMG